MKLKGLVVGLVVMSLIFASSTVYSFSDVETQAKSFVQDLYTVDGEFLGRVHKTVAVQIEKMSSGVQAKVTEDSDYDLEPKFASIPAYHETFLDGIKTNTYFITNDNRVYKNGRSFTIDKETVTTYVTVHEISATVDIEVVDKQTGQMLFEEDGVPFSKILPLLETSTEGKRKKRAVPIAIPFVVAGIEKLVTITGIGTVLYAKHKMEERDGPIGKPNLKGQGLPLIEKKKAKNNWRSNPNKDPNRPMKKHTPSKKHKGGK